MTDSKIVVTPTIKEPKITHALAASYAFNLKLCHILFGMFLFVYVRICLFQFFLCVFVSVFFCHF